MKKATLRISVKCQKNILLLGFRSFKTVQFQCKLTEATCAKKNNILVHLFSELGFFSEKGFQNKTE